MTTTTRRPPTTAGAIFRWRSLKTRVTLFTLTFFLVSIWSLAFYASRMLREDMQRVLGEQQLATVSLAARDINDELGDRLKVLEKVANRITPVILGNAVSMQRFLEDRPAIESMFSGGLWVARLDGTAIADVPVSKGRIGVNYTDRDYIIEALKGKATIGKPIIGKKSLAPAFVMGVPIRDAEGIVRGVLTGAINLGIRNFLDRITDSHYGKTGGYLLAAPQHKLFITGTDKSRIMQPLPAPGMNPMHDRYMQGFEGFGTSINSRGIEELSAAKQIPVAGWFVVAVLPTEEAFVPIRAMQQRMLLATIFLTLLAGGLTWWMLKRQLAPVFTTIKTLTALSDTDQPLQPLPITRQDEIGELIGGFNRLLATLGQRGEALKKSELRFQQLAGQSRTWAWEVDQKGLYTSVSPMVEVVLGYRIEDLIGKKHFYDLHDESEREAFKTAALEVFSRKESFLNLESSAFTKDGEKTWMSTNGFPILGENGMLQGYFGTDTDITSRKRMEEEEQRKKEEAVRHAGELAVIAEIGRVISSTLDIDEVYDRFATEAQKLIPSDRVTVNLINPDEKSFTNAYVSGFDVPERRPGSIIPMAGSVSEIFLQRRSGQIIHVESHEDLVRQFPGLIPSFVVQAGIRSLIGVPLISRNEVIGILHFRSKTLNTYTERDLQLAEKIGMQIAGAIANTRLFSDLSKTEQSLRESEEHYHDLFNKANEGLLILTPDGQLSEVNQAFAEMHGYTVDELNLKDISELDVLTDRALTDRTEIARRIKAGEVVRFEVEHYHKDGHTFPLTVTSSLIQLRGQNFYLAFHQDITDRRRAREVLEEEHRKLKQALDEVKTLRGIMPICAYCKKIRDDDGYWNQVEKYVSDHTDAKFSHGICPTCFEREMKGIDETSS